MALDVIMESKVKMIVGFRPKQNSFYGLSFPLINLMIIHFSILPILSESEPSTNDPNSTPAINELIVAGLSQDLRRRHNGIFNT